MQPKMHWAKKIYIKGFQQNQSIVAMVFGNRTFRLMAMYRPKMCSSHGVDMENCWGTGLYDFDECHDDHFQRFLAAEAEPQGRPQAVR